MKRLAGAVLLFVALALVAAWWLLETEPGLHWAAARAQAAAEGKLALEGLRGALAHDVHVERVGYADEKMQVEARGIALRLELLAFLGGRAGLRSLRMESLEVKLADGGGPPSPPALAFGLRIDSAEIGRIDVQTGQQRVVVEGLRLRDAAVRQNGAVAALASFALRDERYPAELEVRVGGTLERLEVSMQGTVAAIPATAKALLRPFSPQRLEAIDAEAGPIDLNALDERWPRTALGVKLAGKASAAGLAGTLSARNAQPGPLDTQRVPVTAAEARFATDFASLSLQELKIALAPAGTLAGRAELRAGRASFELRATALDLRALRSTLRRTELNGRLNVDATEQSQSIQGTLAQSGMSITADALRAGDVLEIRSLRASAEGGEASGSARLRLAQPMSFEARLKLSQFDPARFGSYPAGSLSGNLDATGVLGDDYRIDARWTLLDSTLRGEAFASRGAARILPRRVTRLNADAQLGAARLRARGDFGHPGDALAWELEAPQVGQFLEGVAGRLRASGRLTGTWANPQGDLEAQALALRLPNRILLRVVAAKASGSLARHEAQLSVQAEGLDLDARLRGGWSSAQGWAGEIGALRNAGAYPMRLMAPAPLRISPERVHLGRLEATLGQGRLLVNELAWSPERLASSGEFSALPAQWLVLAAGASQRVRSTLLVDGHWSLSAAPRLTGTAALHRAAGDLTVIDGAPIALGLEKAALEARFDNGQVKAKGSVTARFATVALEGELAPEPGAPGLGITAHSPLAFQARVAFVDLRMLTRSMLREARIDGRLSAELRGSGTLASPSLAGSLRGEAIALDVPPYGVYLKNGELRAILEGDRLRVTSFSIQGGEGRLTATGTLPLRFAEGGARLAWQAERFGLLERPDLRLTASGAGELQLIDGRMVLVGALRADRGYLELEQERLPRLGDDVVIIGQQRAPPKERVRVPVALDVQLDLGDDLQVRGYGLEGRLAGRLQLETTKEGELRAYGRIHAVNATFFAYGHRLQVDPGVAVFDGPLDNPSLQMTAWRRNQQVEAGVQVTGTAHAPRVQLVSKPPVPEGERLSWLVLGRAPGDATKADLGLLQAAAGALLARGDQMPFDRRIARAFGLDEISLRGSGEVADRVVALGKRLSERLYISYEQGIGAAASALVKLDFSLTQRLSVRAQTGTSSGLGLFYRFSWD